jgi:hypothetical protein
MAYRDLFAVLALSASICTIALAGPVHTRQVILPAAPAASPGKPSTIPSGPITISKGGTYSGLNVSSTNSTPAITITTNSPVTITNSTITNSGADGIMDWQSGVSITITNCNFIGVNPNVAGMLEDCAIDLGYGTEGDGPSNLVVTHNTFTSCGHVVVSVSGAAPGANINISNNWFTNLQGCPSNGNGGWETAQWTNYDARTHAIQIGGAPGINCQIEWNLVQNQPFISSEDDEFNIYDSSGTSANWIQCSNNFLDGMYPGIISGSGAQHEDGAGFTTDGQPSDPAANQCGYIMFQNDYAVNVCGKNMQLPIGHDIIFDHFYSYSTGYTPDATQTPMWSYNAGIIAGPGSGMYNNVVQNSFAYGVRPPDGEFDPNSSGPQMASYSLNSGTGITYTNNTSWSASSTSPAALFAQWQNQLGQAGQYVGNSAPVALSLSTLAVAPASLTGGQSANGSVGLSSAATGSGVSVSLQSSSSDAHVPSSVSVASGSSGASFAISTSTVSVAENVTITASYSGYSVQSVLTLNAVPASLSSIGLSQTTIIGGQSLNGTVVLSASAGSSGVVVSLHSSSSDAQVPSSITIPAGSKSGSLTVSTSIVSAAENVTLTASIGSNSVNAVLSLNPPAAQVSLKSFTSSQPSIIGGQSTGGSVVLSAAAGSGGAAISLQSSSSTAQVPSTVIVPAGSTSASLTITTSPPQASQNVTLTATLGSSSQVATVTVSPPASGPAISSLVLNSYTLTGGHKGDGLVQFAGPISATSIVKISTSSSLVSVQPTVRVYAGRSFNSFPIKTGAVKTQTVVTITVSLNGSSASAKLTLKP